MYRVDGLPEYLIWGYDLQFSPIVGVNVSIPLLRWGARFKTNRQQKAYVGIQKLQQSYITDNINEELSAALSQTDRNGVSGKDSKRKPHAGR